MRFRLDTVPTGGQGRVPYVPELWPCLVNFHTAELRQGRSNIREHCAIFGKHSIQGNAFFDRFHGVYIVLKKSNGALVSKQGDFNTRTNVFRIPMSKCFFIFILKCQCFPFTDRCPWPSCIRDMHKAICVFWKRSPPPPVWFHTVLKLNNKGKAQQRKVPMRNSNRYLNIATYFWASCKAARLIFRLQCDENGRKLHTDPVGN